MKDAKNINRRKWLKMGLGLAAGTAGSAFTLSRLSPTEKDCDITPRQELGPFPPIKARSQPDHDIDLTQVKGQSGTAVGDIIVVLGKILDSQCNPVAEALVEIWQSNHYGKYNHEYDTKGQDDPNFQGWGQAITNKEGQYRFKTIIPGLYGNRTRHIHFKVARRGYHELVTQLYFDGEQRNKTDGLLNALTHEEQLVLIRKLNRDTEIPNIQFDIHIDAVKQGLPQKVLAEYAGRYEMHHKGTQYEEMLNELSGGPYDRIYVDIGYAEGLLYFTLPFSPKSEATWKEKDLFDAAAFYLAELAFNRRADGMVNELAFRWKDSPDFKGTRI